MTRLKRQIRSVLSILLPFPLSKAFCLDDSEGESPSPWESSLLTNSLFCWQGCNPTDVKFRGYIILPQAATMIRHSAFSHYFTFRSTDLSWLSHEEEINSQAFPNCGLVAIALPSVLRSVGNFMFEDYTLLPAARLSPEFGSLSRALFHSCMSSCALAVGDMARAGGIRFPSWPGELNQLDLIGRDFASFARWPIAAWLVDLMAVVSAGWAGKKLRWVGIRRPGIIRVNVVYPTDFQFRMIANHIKERLGNGRPFCGWRI
jgi:hypothetical protein